MLTLVLILLAIVTAMVCLPLAAWTLECLVARRPAGDAATPVVAPPFAVVVPAHNEEMSIASTLADIFEQLREGDRLLVVADNCTDATAANAAAAGAAVIERHDPSRRGKGYALAKGFAHLAAGAAPDVLIVVDADCRLAPHALARLAGATEGGHPVQGDYQLVLPPDADIGARLSAFAFRVKNLVRPLGAARLGWPSPLGGSGMAFPRRLLDGIQIGSGEIVEDLVLSLDLALRGRFVRFEPGARITSAVAPSGRGRSVQRQRWIGGHLAAARRFAPQLIRAALRGRDVRQLAMALDLLVPPLTLLGALLVLVACGGIGLALVTQALLPLAATLPALLFAFTVTITWRRFGRDLLSGWELAALPLRLVKRLPGIVTASLRGGGGWTRTERESN